MSTNITPYLVNTMNILENWRSTNFEENYAQKQAQDIQAMSTLDTKEKQANAKEKRGNNVGKAGASGITASSFNDYLLSEDLKSARDIHQSQTQARNQASSIKLNAQNKEDSFVADGINYSLGLLSNVLDF